MSIPIRLLNRTGYTVVSPATLVLNPSAKVVLAPSGEPASKIVPQAPDSTRGETGESVWLIGTAGSIALNDSTASRTLSIRLESAVTSALVTFSMEGRQLTSQGWPIITSEYPALDATKLIQRPGTNVIMFRTTATLEFVDGVSDATKQTFFAQNSMSVLGVTSEGVYFVAIPDPGLSITDFDAYFALLAAKPEILRALPAFHTGIKPIMDSRFPADAVARGDWFTQSPFLWAMKAIRAPLAWGCETGTYGSSQVKVGLLEWAQDPIHPELLASTPTAWAAPNSAMGPWDTTSLQFRDESISHSAGTGGILTASGEDSRGMAGVSWKTKLLQFSILTPGRRSILNRGDATLLMRALKANPPRVLNVSVDLLFPQLPATQREGLVARLQGQWGALLDSVPNLLLVKGAGNFQRHTSVANYVVQDSAGLFMSALLLLRQQPQYANRIVIVAGTKAGNQFWDISNSFDNAIDIGAPAENVGTIDSVVTSNNSIALTLVSGTSYAAPMVAGGAALLLAMDGTLSPSQVKDYLIRGAQVSRNDSTTGASITPIAVTGVPNATFYQLDVYGAVSLLSKERAGTPICGYPVIGSFRSRKILLFRNGLFSVPTDSVSAPAVGGVNNTFVRIFSIAQGGRRIAINGDGVIQVVSQGGTLLHSVSGILMRFYLERDTVDYLSGGSIRRYRQGSATVTMPFTYADGSPVTAGPYVITASRDGRFVAYTAGRGIYAKRFSDQGTEALTAVCVLPCLNPEVLSWSQDSRTLLSAFRLIDGAGSNPSPWSQDIVAYNVAVNTEVGAFAPEPNISQSGGVINTFQFSSDGALVFTFGSLEAGGYAFGKRPAAALGTVAGQVMTPYLGYTFFLPNVRPRGAGDQ